MRQRTLLAVALPAVLLTVLALSAFAQRRGPQPSRSGRPVGAHVDPRSRKTVWTDTRHGSADEVQPLLTRDVGSADYIAVGTIDASTGDYNFLRDYPTQFSLYPLAGHPQRTYTFTVEQNLKGTVAAVNASVTVANFAGATLSGTSYRFTGLPWLIPGNRYILFLKEDEADSDRSQGYIWGELDGTNGKQMELGEKQVMNSAELVQLTGGNAVAASDGYTTATPAYIDYAITGVSESTAIANIQSAITDTGG
jgi:hypothetical protein